MQLSFVKDFKQCGIDWFLYCYDCLIGLVPCLQVNIKLFLECVAYTAVSFEM